MAINYHTLKQNGTAGTTGTGLDQLADLVSSEVNLTNTISTPDMDIGLRSINGIMGMISQAVSELGLGSEGLFTANDILQINQYIRTNHLDEYKALFGASGFGGWETGWQLIYGEGAAEKYNRQTNIVDHHLDGLMRLGQEFQNDLITGGNRGFRQQAPYSSELLADILNVYWKDPSTTNTGLDRLSDSLKLDRSLHAELTLDERNAAAEEMNQLNELILEAMDVSKLSLKQSLNTQDISDVLAYVDANSANRVPSLSAEASSSTSPILKAMEVTQFRDTEALLKAIKDPTEANIAGAQEVINYYLIDQSSTNTGLDEIVQIIKSESVLGSRVPLSEINAAAEAANQINSLIKEAVEKQNLDEDGIFSIEDVMAISNYIHTYHYERFLELRGSKEGEASGINLILGEGSNALYQTWLGKCNQVWGENMIDTTINSIFSLGFGIQDEKLIDPSDWLKRQIDDSDDHDVLIQAGFGAQKITGTDEADRIISYSDAGEPDMEQARSGSLTNDRLSGGAGADSFEFLALMNAKREIINKHTDSAGNIDWMAIMKENSKRHDHWVESIGNDVITDFSLSDGDSITLRGHTVDVKSLSYGVDDEGSYSLISLYSNQMKGGAHHLDDLGTIKVYGDRVTMDNIQVDGSMMIMDGIDTLAAEFTGQSDQWGKTLGFDVREVAQALNQFYLDTETSFGTEGRDRWRGDGYGEDHWFGMGGNDQLWSRAGNDYVDGGAGNDDIKAGTGDDYVIGGSGNDYIRGEQGNDILIGGTGSDRVSGGSGDDLFILCGDGARDKYWGGKGADTYMIWADSNIGLEFLHDMRAEDQIYLGGDVSYFTIGGRYGRFNKTVNLFDSDNNSLGRLAIRGSLSENQIVIDPLKFKGHEDHFLKAGVDIAPELEQLAMLQESHNFDINEEGDYSIDLSSPSVATTMNEEAQVASIQAIQMTW